MTKISQDIFRLDSLEETTRFGQALGGCLLPGDVLCLDGDLGAGKTTLSQQIAQGLQVPSECYVTSPSFAIMHEYPGGRLVMYHMDFYRLFGSDDVVDSGFDEYFYLDGVTVIEWSERATDVLPDERLHLLMRIDDNGGREVVCSYYGTKWRERIRHLLTENGLSWAQLYPGNGQTG